MAAPHTTALHRRGIPGQVSSRARDRAGRGAEGRMFGTGGPAVGAALDGEWGKRAGVSRG